MSVGRYAQYSSFTREKVDFVDQICVYSRNIIPSYPLALTFLDFSL